MTSVTIDLFGPAPIVSDRLLQNTDFDLDKDDMSILRITNAQFQKQRNLSDEIFDEWLNESNSDLFKKIHSFIENALDLKENNDFREVDSELIHPAQVILGLQTLDHAATLNKLEDYVAKHFESMHILRLRESKIKRANLLTILDECYDEPYVLVIVEETETFERVMIETMIHKLHHMLSTTETERILLLFCISGSWLSVPSILSTSSVTRMRRVTRIVKEPYDTMTELPGRLLRRKDIYPKIGPTIYPIIEGNFKQIDASITNLRHMFQIMALHHYVKSVSLLALSQDKLIKILKNHPYLLENFSELTSVRNSYALKILDWKNPAKVATYCAEQTRLLDNNHKFLMNQIDSVFIIIEDETDIGFPDNPEEIYEELCNHDDLGGSANFVDAVGRIKTFPRDRLVKRLKKCISEHPPIKTDKSSQDVSVIARKFLNKLDNNDEYKIIVSELADALICHAEFLRNPLRMPLNEAVYSTLRNARLWFQPSHRFHASRLYYDKSTYYGRLFKLISNCPAVISLNDLFDEFLDTLKSDPIQKIQSQQVSKEGVKRKMTPKKSQRAKMEHELSPRKKLRTEFMDVGLSKAIFVDLIEAMEFQGFLKRDTRKSKRGIVTKTAWLEDCSE